MPVDQERCVIHGDRLVGFFDPLAGAGRAGPRGLVLDPSLMLTASEISACTFCPQAWYLQRCPVPVTDMAKERRRFGSGMHREIGRQTDLVQAAGALQTILLLAIGVLLVALVLRGLG